ncbi:uncharacterized protein LAJ45_01052 [Morchella importuna]|uniref:uncharacterized protein n=1 Tax=Morchella importuna TaxID=1174673 RepID=UPI001E8E63A4|nr:uncharacterized protein LAJ45_01052 [Morchella importuna]KAH8154524.1 hypothetical protein LAJ45_01052 [Morchella importuna]
MSSFSNPHDRSELTGTNRLPPVQETRGATVTKTSTRERTVISTFTSFAALPQPTDASEGDFQPPPVQPITTVSLTPPPTATATEVVVVVSVPPVEPTQATTSIFMRPAGTTFSMPSTLRVSTSTSNTRTSSYSIPKASSTDIGLQVVSTTPSPSPAGKGGGGTTLSPALIAGISAGAAVAIVAAILTALFFHLRRRNKYAVDKKTMLKREIGRPVPISTSNEGGGSADAFFRAGGEKPMLSPHESEAMLLPRNTSPTTQSSGYGYGRPTSYTAAADNNAAISSAPQTPITPGAPSPTSAAGRGYYGTIPVIVEPPARAVPKRPARPASSFYPTNSDELEPYAAQRLENPFTNIFAPSAYADAGNPYAVRSVTQRTLNVPKSSHVSDREPSVLSGAGGGALEMPDSASYYSVGYTNEYLKGGVRGSRMTTLSEDEPNGALMGSILEQCESSPRPHPRLGEEAEERWYGAGASGGGRNLIGRGGGGR